MLLSLLLRRGEVLVGKFVGRIAVLAVSIIIGVTLAVPFISVIYGEFPGVDYFNFVTRALVTGIVYVAIVIGISAINTRGKALTGVVSVYIFLDSFGR